MKIQNNGLPHPLASSSDHQTDSGTHPVTEKTSRVALNQLDASEDMYDLDLDLSDEATTQGAENSSRRHVCSQCACDTAGCGFTNSCQSRCGGTHCLC